jgi:hypothetical protein
MRLLIAGGVLCSLLACSGPERHHAAKNSTAFDRYPPNRGIPADRQAEAKKPPHQNPGNKPAQVTTRSGSLMLPGPEPRADFNDEFTPTFAPEEAPQPARRFSSEIPQGNRAPLRSSSQSAGPGDKPTMARWIKSLRSDDKEPEPAGDDFQPPTGAMPKSASESQASPNEPGTSIDPRRVYRGPKPPEEIDESRRGSHFSETGLPQTGTEFRGREDSAF